MSKKSSMPNLINILFKSEMLNRTEKPENKEQGKIQHETSRDKNKKKKKNIQYRQYINFVRFALNSF